jgi:putative PIN family toxin of toxin-antitoxin system
VRIVAVFDTNILLSGIGWKGRPLQCIELARAGLVEGVVCRELLEELAEKLQTKLGFSAQQALDAVADLLGFLRLVVITGNLKVVVADPDDDKVLECAVIGNATHIVTGDRRHLLPLATYQGIAIVTAAEFLTVASVPGS